MHRARLQTALMASLTDFEDRFSALLKPIRNLTENWNINLASYLEDYLSELEHIEITFDGGKTTMNFAEAAMLIQGSACIYSKKVEFLYTLVVQMLELLQNKRKAQEKAADGTSNANDAVQSKNVDDEDDDFVPLDDLVVATNITLKNSQEKTTFVFLKQPPVWSLMTKDPVLGHIPLYSEHNEIIGKRSDFQILSLQFAEDGLTLSRNDALVSIKIRPPSVCEKDAENLQVDEFGDANAGDDGDNDPGLPPSSPLNEDLAPEEVVKKKEQRAGEPKKPRTEDDRPCHKKGKKLELLDPFDAHPHLEKEFKKGTTYRILPELQNSSRTLRTRKPKQCIADHCRAYYSHAHKFPQNRRKRPKVLDCENLYWNEHKLRLQNKRSQKSTKVQSEPADDDHDAENNDDADEVADGVPGSPLLNGDSPDHEGDLFDENSVWEGCHNAPGLEKTFDIDDSMVKTSYEKLVQELVENYMTSSKNFAQQSELAQKVSEWEQRIAPKLADEVHRGHFDIHDYGTKVLGAFAQNNRKQTLPFSEIVSNLPSYEKARYFSAMLQLANTYNVQIEKDGFWEAGDRIDVTLLSCVRHHEQLNDYIAPSTEGASSSSR